MFHGFRIQILGAEKQVLGIQQFRTDDRQRELLKVHPVIAEEPAQGKGQRRQDTHPAGSLCADCAVLDKIEKDRHSKGHSGTNKLPKTEAEEYAFLVVPDFLVDFDFDKNSPLILALKIFLCYNLFSFQYIH